MSLAIGRATALILQFNHSNRLQERAELVAMGQYFQRGFITGWAGRSCIGEMNELGW